MIYSDMPHFNGELIRWLIAYFINTGSGEIKKCYEEIINFAKIDSVEFRNIINEMIINGYVIKNIKPIYAPKPESSKVWEVIRYECNYFLTQKGNNKLCFGWQFASSAIPQELYDEVVGKIPFV